MRLALAQINPTVGAIDANADLVLSFAARADNARCDFLVFPELCLTGYPPKDLLLQEGFLNVCERAAARIAAAAPPDLTLVLGTPAALDPHASRITNSLLAFRDGRLLARYDKRLLPTYDVFDESRYFTPGNTPVVLPIPSRENPAFPPVLVGLSICEDLWRGTDAGFANRYLDQPDPVAELCAAGAQVIVNPSASPFVLGKGLRHRDIIRRHAVARRVTVAAVNQVGGNDDLLFDGHAAVFDPAGTLVAAAPGFAEDLLITDLSFNSPARTRSAPTPKAPTNPPRLPTSERAPSVSEGPALARPAPATPDPLAAPDEELLFRALVMGIRDYCRKTGFKSCVLGLSGGIDSAVVAVLAAAALGPDRVLGVSMPSRYSSRGSRDDAASLASNLAIPLITLDIESPFSSLLTLLTPHFHAKPTDITEENLQSRVRGTLLMALSNKHGHLLLTTGNKSELAVGYCTLYGDMNGGLAVLSDVTKVLVYRLARWINHHPAALNLPTLTPPIPEASITKPPSAELRPGQTDQDSLPPYHILDEIIERYVELRQSPTHIISEMCGTQHHAHAAQAASSTGPGTHRPSPHSAHADPAHAAHSHSTPSPAEVARIVRLIDLAEYKRRQSPVGLKVTRVAFGPGRRVPIAQGWRG